MNSGESLRRYAKRHRLSIGALYNAKSALKRDGFVLGEAVQSSFVAVQVAATSVEPIRCRVLHGAWQLEMERLPDARWLHALMRDDDAAA
jgi:hypothetical protein